jgi:hypothetical protein
MVFRTEAEFDRGATNRDCCSTSDEWAGNFALEQLSRRNLGSTEANLDFEAWDIEENVSDTTLDIREVKPDLDAAKVRAFSADGSGDAGTQVAWGANVAGEFRVNSADLSNFIH